MDERTCYSCIHYSHCFLKKRIEDALKGAWMLCNREGEGAPLVWTALFDTLAKVCVEYMCVGGQLDPQGKAALDRLEGRRLRGQFQPGDAQAIERLVKLVRWNLALELLPEEK